MAEREQGKSKGRPKDPEKRESILRSAHELFLANGLNAVSMESIADLAGVSKATVYSHFQDKESLFLEMLDAETGDYQHPPETVSLKDDDDLRNRLIVFGKSLLSVLTRPGVLDLGRLLVNEAHRHPKQAAHFFAKGPEATHHRLAELLKMATKQGFLNCDNTELAADHLLSMWIGQRHLRQQLGLCQPPKTGEITKHVEACVRVILRAFAP